MSEIRVAVQKPLLPTLWLDTAIGIKLAKVAKGEIRGTEATSLTLLKSTIVELSLERKLLCVQGDQDDEYAGLRLDDETADEFDRLSLGIRLAAGLAVKDRQMAAGIRALRDRIREIRLPYTLFFHRDPIEVLDEIEKNRIFAAARPPGTPWSPEVRKGRRESATYLERLRQKLVAAGVTYEEQLAKELQGEPAGLLERGSKLLAKMRSGEALSCEDYGTVLDDQQLLSLWTANGGKPPGVEGFLAFLASDIYAALPVNRISSQLSADLLTGPAFIRTGDSGDVALLSVAIPVCHLVLTDRRMEQRIRRRCIDAEWNTRAFSERSLAALIRNLESLR